MITHYNIIYSDSLGLSAIWNKEGISMEYWDIKGQKTLKDILCQKVMEIPLNTHQNSWKISSVKYRICWGFFFIYFVCLLFVFTFPHIMQ